MITAKEARDLIVTSEASVNRYLSKIDPLIREYATKGYSEIFLYVEGLWDAEEMRRTNDKVATPLQECVIRELKKLGFSAVYGPDNDPAARYVPRGLADDDGNGPMHINCGITVKW